MASFRFPKTARLRASADFDRVFQRRCSLADRRVVIYFSVGDSERCRLGLVVSRKVGNAVTRNRWKRALREAFRRVQQDLPGHLDLVVLPRRGVQPVVAELQESFQQLARRGAAKLASSRSKVRP